MCKKLAASCILLGLGVLTAGCNTASYETRPGKTYTTRPDNTPGRPTTYEDPGTPGSVQGIGAESQDIVSMSSKMMRDMMTNAPLINRANPARVIVDAEYFKNESTDILNKNMITDRLRVELNRAANGKMIFVARHNADMVESERSIKREGIVDGGTRTQTPAAFGGDFRLSGRITSLDTVSNTTGVSARFHQFVFEMVDLESGQIVWSGMYDFKKSGADDVVYR